MTTEREFQEGQDRIRRAQGKREYLKSRGRGSGGFRTSTSLKDYPRAKRANSNQMVLWVIGIIVGFVLVSNIVPYLRDWNEGDRPNGRIETLR